MDISKPKQLIIEVKELLSDRNKWCQKGLAIRADGYPTYPKDPKAVSFCLLGALEYVALKEEYRNYTTWEMAERRIDYAINKGRSLPIRVSEWNDDPNTKYEDVMKLIDDVIQSME